MVNIRHISAMKSTASTCVIVAVILITLIQLCSIGWLLRENISLRAAVSSASTPSSWTTTTPSTINNDLQIQCFYNGKSFHFRCITPEEHRRRSVHDDMSQATSNASVWATVVGIGPPKSGSTELIQLLQTHPHVSMGRNKQGSMELVFFNNNPGQGGVSRYQSYFQRKEGIQHYVEKTPAYAYSITAPYLMRVFLKKKKVQLLYTLRDAVEEDVSWYLHLRGQQPQEVLSYSVWTKKRILAWSMEIACRDKAFQDLLLPTRFDV